MSRGLERKLLIAGSIWNLILSVVTLFGYSTWFKTSGLEGLQDASPETVVVGTTLIDSVSKVILTFGLFMFVGAIVNFIIAKNVKDDTIQKKIIAWIVCWGLIQLFSMDIVGFVLYLITFVIYMAKNKAIKITQVENTIQQLSC